MAKPKIAVFSGPNATIANSPTLVTSKKGRLQNDRELPGRFDHLVGQILYEPVTVKIRKYTAHPLEEEAKELYHDDGKEYYEVKLLPEDGPYPLPFMGRRGDGSSNGIPFEEDDLSNPLLDYGGRQFFYPDASRIFTDIDRTISGRNIDGEGSVLDRQADYEFIRVLPSGGYITKGEKSGVHYFPYRPYPIARRPGHRGLAIAANTVQEVLASGKYVGGIWMEASPTVEESAYWLSLLIDTDLPLACVAAQRPHGQLSNDGDRNIVDAVGYVLSGEGIGLGVVGVLDERIYAAREFKKADDRPGNYKATGGHGGILGSAGPPVVIWYKPAYKRAATSDVNISKIPQEVEFMDAVGDSRSIRVRVKNTDGTLQENSIPRVHIIKYGAYMDEDETNNPDHEVDILARIQKGLEEESRATSQTPFHGFVMEGTNPYGMGSGSQHAALAIAACSGMPVVRVGRADPGGMVPVGRGRPDLCIAGTNLDTNKARLLLIASMLKFGRLPKAKDPKNPTAIEREAINAKLSQYQEVFYSH